MEGINKGKGSLQKGAVRAASILTEIFAELETEKKVKRRCRKDIQIEVSPLQMCKKFRHRHSDVCVKTVWVLLA